MKVELEPGKYVVAVSGGVDSMALLHMLQSLPDVKLTVAHFEHGIRSDSDLDRQLVKKIARGYGLPFVYFRGNLGAGASEAQARTARYDFLRHVQQVTGAQAIITAHHQDDVLETAIINLLRGTGRKGLTSLRDHYHLRRPLLHLSKNEIREFAVQQGLQWHEDSTNSNLAVIRNYIRHKIIPRLGDKGRAALLQYIGHLNVVNQEADQHIMRYLHVQSSRQALDRHQFVQLPHDLSLEIMAEWLRSHGIAQFNRRQLDNIVSRVKTLEPGKQIDIDAGHRLLIGRETVVLLHPRVV